VGSSRVEENVEERKGRENRNKKKERNPQVKDRSGKGKQGNYFEWRAKVVDEEKREDGWEEGEGEEELLDKASRERQEKVGQSINVSMNSEVASCFIKAQNPLLLFLPS
jgi:hypothetical protein